MARQKLETVILAHHGSAFGRCPQSGKKVRTQVRTGPHPRIEGRTERRGWCKACREMILIEPREPRAGAL